MYNPIFMGFMSDTEFSKKSETLVIVSTDEESVVAELTEHFGLTDEQNDELWENCRVVAGGVGVSYFHVESGEWLGDKE